MENLIKSDLTRSLQDIVSNLEVLRGKKILITGGTGFVGTWVTRALIWLNDECSFDCKIVLLSRNPNKLEAIDNKLYNREEIMYIKSDIRSIHNLPNDINFIVHAAASPDNRTHMSDPVNTMDVIAIGTKSILDAASRLSSIEGIIHLSSGQVSGNFLSSDIRSIYPEAKRYSESLCLAYRSLYKLPISIVRPFSFIGPFQELNKPWAINTFMQEALNAQPMRIVGNGKPQRSYLYATDMSAWLLTILAKGKRGAIYNVGASEGVSLNEATHIINKVLAKPVEIIVQNHNSDSSIFIPNIENMKEELSVKETFSFEEALKHTLEWNMKRLEN